MSDSWRVRYNHFISSESGSIRRPARFGVISGFGGANKPAGMPPTPTSPSGLIMSSRPSTKSSLSITRAPAASSPARASRASSAASTPTAPTGSSTPSSSTSKSLAASCSPPRMTTWETAKPTSTSPSPTPRTRPRGFPRSSRSKSTRGVVYWDDSGKLGWNADAFVYTGNAYNTSNSFAHEDIIIISASNLSVNVLHEGGDFALIPGECTAPPRGDRCGLPRRRGVEAARSTRRR